ncbi:MAG: hypothetical protein RSC43_05170 [Clostridia bacterium]
MKFIDFTVYPISKHINNRLFFSHKGEDYSIREPESSPHANNKNACISEYIGSHIYNLAGVPACETVLGMYKGNLTAVRKEPLGGSIVTFTSMFDIDKHAASCEVNTVLSAIQEQTFVNREELTNRFWDMFIVDALIATAPRTLDDWGIVYDLQRNTAYISPVLNNNACLYPYVDSSSFSEVYNSRGQNLISKLYSVPESFYTTGGKPIDYLAHILSLTNSMCIDALMRIIPKLSMPDVEMMINSISCISESQKNFYLEILGHNYHMLNKCVYDAQEQNAQGTQNTNDNHTNKFNGGN